MKLSRITRFIRVNLVGLLAFLNLIVIYKKFSIQRPAPVLCKCSGLHGSTNNTGFVSIPAPAPSAGSQVSLSVPVRHDLRGGWVGELKETTCDYTSAVVDGLPILQTGTNRYYVRGDQTSWGRVMWIGQDYFTTDRFLVRLVDPEKRQYGKFEIAGGHP